MRPKALLLGRCRRGRDAPVERQSHLVLDVVTLRRVGDVEPVHHVGGVAIDEGAEQSVPDAQYVAVVAVRPRHFVVVVELVHVGGDYQPAERLVHCQRQRHVAVVPVGEEDGHDAVEPVERHRRPRHDHAEERKRLAAHEVDGVVARPGRHVHVGVAVVHHVQPPHPLPVVQQVVDGVLGNEVQRHHRHQQLQPERHGDPVQQPESGRRRPFEQPHSRHPEGHVDGHGGRQESQVGPHVLPTAEALAKQGPDRLHDEVDRHAHDDPPQLLPGRHRLKHRKELLQRHADNLRHRAAPPLPAVHRPLNPSHTARKTQDCGPHCSGRRRRFMGSVFEAADGAALLSADALLLVDLIRVVDQAFHVGVSTVVIGRGAPPGCEGAEVCEDPIGAAVARGPSVESVRIRAVGSCRPAGGSLELQSALGTDAVNQDLPIVVVGDVPSTRAEWTGVVDRMPVVEASVGADVGFIVVEGRLGSIGGVAPPIVGQGSGWRLRYGRMRSAGSRRTSIDLRFQRPRNRGLGSSPAQSIHRRRPARQWWSAARE